MSQPPKTARDIFLAALDADPAARVVLLDDLCAGDVELRRQVEALLQFHDEPDSFLDSPRIDLRLPAEAGTPNVEPTIDQPSIEALGTVIGLYKLLQKIGEGGFGVVYMAEQKEPVERRVALKIIKPGMDTRQVIARFETEEQALAMMEHPNIARVFDAGMTDSGRPYFVMELVRGVPITDYCDQHHLTPRERLELFVPVCHAVQHAHQKGIIHRDIKPSNVLVALYDDRPVPKVIDFGVAKATNQRLTEKTMFTQFGQIVGTLEYMSPEQANPNQLDIDTRSDVYSLGVLLYELLTGTTPFDRQRLRSAAFGEMMRIIREEEPPKPSTRLSTSESLPSIAANRHIEPRKLSTLVRGELDWIAMKALEKDRARRYETANGLANDIQRYLSDEPVAACPPSAAYRFRKFVSRNKAAMATAGIIVATLLLGTGLATWQAIRAVRAESLAKEHLAAEQVAHHQTEMAEREAKQQLFKTYHAQADAIRASGRPGQRLDALEALGKAVELLEPLGLGEAARDALRDDAIGSMELIDLRPVRAWQARQSPFQGILSLSGDFELLAFSDGESIHIRRLAHPMTDARTIPTIKEQYEQFLRFDSTKRYLFRWRPIHRTLYATEIATGKDVCAIANVLDGFAADFHPRRPLAAVGDRHGVVRCLDLVSGQEVLEWSVGRPIWSVKFDPDGGRLAVGSGEAKLEEVETRGIDVCDAKTGKVVFQMPQLGVPTVLDWRPDGKWLAVGITPEIHLFEVGGAEARHLILQGHRSKITGIQFHPQGRFLASTSWDGTTRLWDSASGQQLLRLEGSFSRFSEDGNLLALQKGLDIHLFEFVAPCAHLWLCRGMTHAVALAPGDRLMASCHDDGVRLWELDKLRQVAYLPIGATHGAAFRFPTGELVTGGKAGLYQWAIRTTNRDGAEKIRLGPPEAIDASLQNLRSVHLSRDGNTLLSEAFYRDEPFLFQMAASGWRQLPLASSHLSPTSFGGTVWSQTALSPDGKWAAAASSDGVRIWNVGNGQHVGDLPTHVGGPICFSPDVRSLIVNSGSNMGIWDVGTWKPLREVSFQSDTPWAVAFTPDSRTAAIGVWGIGAMLFEVHTGRRVATLDLPEKPPVYVGLNFTSNGSRLVAAVDHSGCCVWDLRALRERLASLSLDWNQHPLPKADSARAKPPLRVEVDLGILAEEKLPSPAEKPVAGERPTTDNGESSTDR